MNQKPFIIQDLADDKGTVIDARQIGGGGGGGAVSSVNGQTGAVVLTAADLDDSFKDALLDCFANVAWATEDGQQYYDALESALYPVDHITAVYTQSGTVYDTDSLDSLKDDLVVTAVYEGGNTETVPAANYTLSGTLVEGTSTITVSYGGKTTTFTVIVTQNTYIYALPSAFSSSGTETVDTDISFMDNVVTSLKCDVTITTIDTTTRSIYSNQESGSETQLNALKTQAQSGDKYVWGSGLSWADSKNIATNGDRVRFVLVLTRGDASYTMKYALKNVTQGTSKGSTSTSANVYYNSNTIKLGKTNIDGFIGTVNTFTIWDRALTDAEITAFLTSGESA